MTRTTPIGLFVRAPALLLRALLLVVVYLLWPFKIGRLVRTVSLPRLEAHAVRTALTILGVALGVGGIFAVVLVNRSVLKSATSTVDDIAGRTDLQVVGGASGFSETLLDSVHGVAGVARATPVLQSVSVIHDQALKGERIVVLGMDLIGGADGGFRPTQSPELAAIRRDPLGFLNSPTNLILSKALAERAHLRAQDHLELTTPLGVQQFEVWGVLQENGTSNSVGGSFALMSYQAMQAAFGRGLDLDRIDIEVADRAALADVRAALQARLGPNFRVEAPEQRTTRIRGMLAGLQASLSTGSLIALLIGAFLIYNTMLITVAQRTKELGILRALGTTRAQIVRLLTLEGMLIGVLGSLLGVGLGAAIAYVMLHGAAQAVSRVYVPIGSGTLEIDFTLAALAFSMGVTSSTLAAVVPALQASRIHPAQTLRKSPGTLSGPRSFGFQLMDGLGLGLAAVAVGCLYAPPYQGFPFGAFAACAFIMLGAALLMPRVVQLVHLAARGLRARLGIEVQMANENLPRDLTRSAITAGALMMGVAMSTAFAVFIGSFIYSTNEWLEQSIPAELFISRSGPGGMNNVPMSDALTAPLGQMKGVEAVERVRITDTLVSELPVKLVAAEMALYGRYARMLLTEGEQSAVIEGMTKQNGLLLSENLAHKLGLHRGDYVTVPGRWRLLRFEVVGVRVDYTSDLGSVMIDRATYEREFDDHQVDMYKLHTVPDADLEQIRSEIERLYARAEDLLVLTGQEFRSAISALLERVFSVMRALQAVAIAIAALGIVNALLASTLDRTREFGVVRAVGMLARQLRKMIVSEALLLGFSGVLLGIGVGLWLGYVMTVHVNIAITGWTFLFRPRWGSLIELLGVVLAVSVVAGWYPARLASRQSVVSSLAYE